MRENNFVRAAGQLYKQLTTNERAELKREATKEVSLTIKEVLQRADKLFKKQKKVIKF